MKRRVWGNRVISHFAVPGHNLFLSLNPHTKQAQRIVAVASRWHEDSNQQNIASSRSLSFSQMPPIVWGEHRKSMPLTVDFGNQRWVSAQKKLLRTWAPISGLSCQTWHQAVLFFPDCFLKLWDFFEPVGSFSRPKVFTGGPCCSQEFTADGL